MTFQQWMQEVDSLCIGEYLLSIYDLPDMNFHDAYADGESPEEFMAEVLPNLEALAHLVLS